MDQLLLTADETAKLIKMGRSKVYELIASGELPVVRIGTAVRVVAEGLREWVREKSGQAPHSLDDDSQT